MSLNPNGRASRWLIVLPGFSRCGITDHTRLLTQAARQAGATVRQVMVVRPALNEQTDADEIGLDYDPGILARELKNFEPDWVLLQFTPGMFRRGKFIYPLLARFGRVARRARVVIIVHETWWGMMDGMGLRNRLLMGFRRLELVFGWRAWAPVHVLCSNAGHQAELARAGFPAQLLPIYSNIQPASGTLLPPDRRAVRAELAEPALLAPDLLVCVIFARIHPDWPCEELLAALHRRAVSQGQRLLVVSIGVTGYRELGWNRVVCAAGAEATLRLGQASPEKISRVIMAADLGLSATPIGFWSKSSACHAMVVHGTPVVFTESAEPADGTLPPEYGLVQNGELVMKTAPAARRAVPVTPASVWAQLEAAIVPPAARSK